MKDELDTVSDIEYAFEKIILHIGQAPDIKRVFRWYGNSATHDKLEPRKHILWHFNNRYRLHQKQKNDNLHAQRYTTTSLHVLTQT